MRTDKIQIRRWVDRHLHLRRGKMLQIVLPCTLRQRPKAAVIMGNLPHPYETSTIDRAVDYWNEIRTAHNTDFLPIMTLYLTDEISPDEVVEGFHKGAWAAAKLYMANQKGEGGTTGSQHGVRNLLGRYKVFEAMERNKIPLLGHWEAVEDDVDEFDREIVSVDRDLKPILKTFPGLPVVFEHISDGRAADFVAEVDHPIYATVTPQHLIINRNAMFKGGMNPVHYCKPVPKREKHRLRVRYHVTSGNRRFGGGTDSAPHDKEAKSRCCGCAAGIFSPYAVEQYTEVFYEDDAMEHLNPFLSESFLHVYGLKPCEEMLTLVRKSSIIPLEIGNVPVFGGGKELTWTLVG